ncbi:MAG: SAM-dependent methyltransferase, partial [Gammaproteobacteria bacterium]|nr:SAM-dependent methyltransferase [Gammaproteobacteria bacterium]
MGIGPLVTAEVHEALLAAARAGQPTLACSLDLARSTTTVEVGQDGWAWQGQRYPFLPSCKDRTIYHWTAAGFEPVARFTTSLIKLVPTEWGTPTFEIDGIKMLVSEQVSPWEDARRKVALVQPRGKVVLDTCGGLGYFAAWCLASQAARILSCEKNPDVV